MIPRDRDWWMHSGVSRSVGLADPKRSPSWLPSWRQTTRRTSRPRSTPSTAGRSERSEAPTPQRLHSPNDINDMHSINPGETMSTKLPQPIAAYIQAANAHDTQALLRTLTVDAVVTDEGREYHGHEEIRKWSHRTNQ